jgi:hypothetical protein
MMIVKANADSEAGKMPSKEMMDAMGAFNQELINAGVMLAGDGLHPSSEGFRVRFGGGKPKVIDGPFAEAKELIAGYWMLDVKSREEAIQWASRVPFAEGEELEVRRVFEMSDFPPDLLSPELAAQEQAFREAQRQSAPKPQG